MKASFSNRLTSCSFLSSAPWSGGISFRPSLLAQGLGGDVLGDEELQPVEQFRGRGLLLQARHLAHLQEDPQGLLDEAVLDARVVHIDDALQRLGVGELDVVEEAAAQERVRQLLLVVRRDDHDRPPHGLHGLAGLVDVELHPVEFGQQVVGELDVGLVDLVDEQHRALGRGERLPELAAPDVVADVRDPRVAELRVAQARDRVVLVEPLLRLRCRLDVPDEQRRAQALGDLLGQHGLAGAGLALHQERAFEDDGGVDGRGQVGGRDVGLGAGKAHRGLGEVGLTQRVTRYPAVPQALCRAASPTASRPASTRIPRCPHERAFGVGLGDRGAFGGLLQAAASRPHLRMRARSGCSGSSRGLISPSRARRSSRPGSPRFTSDFCGCGRVLPSMARSILIST